MPVLESSSSAASMDNDDMHVQTPVDTPSPFLSRKHARTDLEGIGGCPTPEDVDSDLATEASTSATPANLKGIEQLMLSLHEQTNKSIGDKIGCLSNSMSNALQDVNGTLQAVQHKFESEVKSIREELADLRRRVETVESTDPPPSAPPPVQPRRRVTFARRSQSAGPRVVSDEKARNPNCVRLKGFLCKLPKSDLIVAAQEFISHFQLEHTVTTYHAGNVAGSCVVEFNTQLDAKKAVELSKGADKILWTEGNGLEPHPLFLCWDESEESRALGRALHFAWDAAFETIIPTCPSGSKLNTDKSRGNLNVVIGKRFYTILCIEIDEADPEQFNISGPRKNGSFKLPNFITTEMIDAVIAQTRKEPIFN